MNKTKRVILTVGVSGSGKTTWANNFINMKNDFGETWYNLNRDDMRAKVFFEKTGSYIFRWYEWKKKWEKEATEKWHEHLDLISSMNYDGIIISDTNLNSKTRDWLIDYFSQRNFEIDIKLFPISYEEAVKNDLKRDNPVGAFVIAEQMEKYWKQFHKRYEPDTNLPKAIIVDMDGTLAHMVDRGPFEWSKVEQDKVDEIVRDVITGLYDNYHIVIVSGRDGVAKEKTLSWLENNIDFNPDDFFIRQPGDNRKDYLVKEELFWEFIAPKYNVVLAIDDRPQVILNCWTALGIKTLAYGNQSIHF